MPQRHFVSVRFRPEDQRTYTYHWDGEPFAAGEEVKVDDARGGGGWKRVTVVSVSDEPPPFPTKPILRKLEEEIQEQPI